jgi:hypothetical protein
MSLEPDIIDRVQLEFAESDRQAVIDALVASGRSGRIGRCIVFAAKGSLERLHELITLADRDYRDVILAAEYEGPFRDHVRDFSMSFLVKSDADYWVRGVLVTMEKYGYHLTCIRSRVASDSSHADPHNRREGTATFSNGRKEITVVKQNSEWALVGEPGDLRKFALNEVIADEARFQIQLDYYLSRQPR